jgi:hypothetical protein
MSRVIRGYSRKFASSGERRYLYSVKKAVHIVFVCLYLAVTTGITVVTHFCGSEPVSSGMLSSRPAEPDCCCGTEEPATGCCTNTFTSLVVHDDHAASPAWDPLPLAGTALPVLTCAAELPSVTSFTVQHEGVSPPGSAIPLPLLNCSLLI